MSMIEAFLVIEQPRQRLSHWCSALASLDDPSAPPFATVMAYYDPTTDEALIGLRYDPMAVGDNGLAFLIEVALLAEVGMIQPAELTDGDRRRFVGDRLARCTLQVGDQRHVTSALTELMRRVRDLRATVRPPVLAAVPLRTTPPPIPAAAASSHYPRGDTADPHLLVHAKGTRDGLPQALPRSTRDRLPPPPSAPSRITRSDRFPPTSEERSAERAVSPNVVARNDVHRAETVEVLPPTPPVASRRARSPSNVSTDQFVVPGPTERAQPTIIHARYLRSGRWVPIRIGALSLKGAAMLAGALPRTDDHVDVALSFGAHRALVRGNVGKVSSAEEAATSGAPTFSVNFQLDDASRRQLTSLLTAARAAKVTIKPPPPRAARRFPVEWPVGLGTHRGVVRAEALDVSREGMFVRPLHALAMNTIVNFSAVLDDGEAPAAGRARVVRHITEADARAGGLSPGYGLKITEMGDADRERWLAFLARIEKRADRRILIGASPARLAELQGCLAAAGYAVTGGTDPGALVQLASGDARPVDAALIDAGWLAPSSSGEWVESLFSARNVPCVTLHGDAKRARAAVDKLLLGS
ncbi:MAG: PilZ domain-containing protein [Myxococcales bacterium]|nr:PilZ domain-containing protein [Myxococcales bacterium]